MLTLAIFISCGHNKGLMLESFQKTPLMILRVWMLLQLMWPICYQQSLLTVSLFFPMQIIILNRT